jgi:uncharacterized coiled-coil protein SlyX
MQDALARTNSLIATLEARLAAQQATVTAGSNGVLASIESLNDQIMDQSHRITNMNLMNSQGIEAMSRILALGEDAVSSTEAEIAVGMEQMQSGLTAMVNQTVVATTNAVESTASGVVASVQSTMAVAAGRLNSQMAPMAGLGVAMANTHYLNPDIPVYRWHMYHVYSNNGVGWFDGNNPRFFGGRHPSQWGDGNTNVWDMHPDIRYMGRLFTRRGVGTQYGATVCSETWYLYSSTDTKYCIALFRIKNTQTRTIGWRTNWYGTGWSGWGNYQTATMNGSQRWGGSCTWWCHRAYTWSIPANSNRNRVSTVIFANGMTHPNHYSDGHHIETTFLGFDGLGLPSGLQYVDDMDSASGRWR